MLNQFKNKKFLVFLDQAIVSGSNFSLGIILARLLSIDVFGQYALLWMLVLFFMSVQQAAIVSPMYSLEPKREDNDTHHLSNVIIIQIIFTFISVFLITIFLTIIPFFKENWDMGLSLMPFCLAGSTFLLQDFLRRYFFLKESYFVVISMDMIAYIGLLMLILIYSRFDTLQLSIVYLLLFFTFLISILFGFIKIKYSNLRFKNIKDTIKEYWTFSKWLSLSNVLQWLTGNLFIVVGGYLLGAWSAGVIRIFQNTMGVFHVLFLAIENFVPISAAKLYRAKGYKHLLNYIYKYVYFGIFSFILLGISFIILTPEKLISFIYGSKYMEYGYLLYWYLLIYFLIYLGTQVRIILRTIESTKTIYIVYLYSMIFSLLFAWPLVLFFKVEGIVLGTFLTQVVMNVIYLKLIRERKIVDKC